MQTLFVLYSALAVFGLGVTAVDLFGVFEHASHDDQSDGGAHDGSHDDASDGGAHDGAAGHDASDDDGSDDDSGSPGAHDDASDGDAAGHDAGSDHGDRVDASPVAEAHHGHGSLVASGSSGARAVIKTIGALRTAVYFSLGAGPTGLFALLTGVGGVASLAWSAGAGVFIAVLSRALRSFVRKDLDSSIKPEEYVMDEATITVPVSPGALGKAAVRHYGVETEVYVRARDRSLSFPKGSRVRIVDWDDACFWIESA